MFDLKELPKSITKPIREGLIKSLMEATNKHKHVKKRAIKKVNAKQKAINDVFNDNINQWGCNTKALAKLLTAMTGVEIYVKQHVDENRLKASLGTMIVPLIQDNGHHYDLKKPFIFLSTQQNMGLKQGGEYGNKIYPTKKHDRYATTKEIEKFVNGIKPENLINMHAILSKYDAEQ